MNGMFEIQHSHRKSACNLATSLRDVAKSFRAETKSIFSFAKSSSEIENERRFILNSFEQSYEKATF